MQKDCESCGRAFEARGRAKYCGGTCRKRAHDKRQAAKANGADPGDTPAYDPSIISGRALLVSVVAQLAQAERLNTYAGQQAVTLADRMCSLHETGSAIASLSKELSRVMALALEGANKTTDPIDELRQRRDAKRTG